MIPSSSLGLDQDLPAIESIRLTLQRNWWIVALRGLCSLAFGVVAISLPEVAMLAMTLLVGAYLMVDGVAALAAALRAARSRRDWGLLAVEGAVGLLAGGVALAWPALTVFGTVLLVAAWAVSTGTLLIVAAWQAMVPGAPWLAIGGIVSLLFGITLLIFPFISAILLIEWLGVYALLFGGALLLVAFRLRDAARADRPRGA